MFSLLKILLLIEVIIGFAGCNKARVAQNRNSDGSSLPTGNTGEGLPGYLDQIIKSKDEKLIINIPVGSSKHLIKIETVETSPFASDKVILLNDKTWKSSTTEGEYIYGPFNFTIRGARCQETAASYGISIDQGNGNIIYIAAKNIGTGSESKATVDFYSKSSPSFALFCHMPPSEEKFSEIPENPKNIVVAAAATSAKVTFDEVQNIEKYVISINKVKLDSCTTGYQTNSNDKNSTIANGKVSINIEKLETNTKYYARACSIATTGLTSNGTAFTFKTGASTHKVSAEVTPGESDGEITLLLETDSTEGSYAYNYSTDWSKSLNPNSCNQLILEGGKPLVTSPIPIRGLLEGFAHQFLVCVSFGDEVISIEDLSARAGGHRIFASKDHFAISNVTAASFDRFCQEQAAKAFLQGDPLFGAAPHWQALIYRQTSKPLNAPFDIYESHNVFRMDGEKITADNFKSDFSSVVSIVGSINIPVQFDQYTFEEGIDQIWVGGIISGPEAESMFCSGLQNGEGLLSQKAWNSNHFSLKGSVGNIHATDFWLRTGNFLTCDKEARVLCVSAEMTE